MQRRKIKARFYIIIIGVIAAVVLAINLLGAPSGGVLELGEISAEVSPIAVIIRDEQIKTTDQFDKIEFLVSEGERVTTGTKVAEIYRLGYSDEIMQNYLSTQKEILAHQSALLEGVVDPKIERLNYDIDQALLKLQDVIMRGSVTDMLTCEQELKALLEERRNVLKEKINTDEKLTGLYALEQNQFERLAEWKQEVLADGAGMVSFYFDGYENTLRDVNALTNELLNNVLKGTKPTNSYANEIQHPLYRLVNNLKWYAAFQTDASTADGFSVGGETTAVFEGYFDRPYTGTLLKKLPQDSGVILVVQFEGDIGPMLSIRKSSATIKQSVQGLKLPAKAVDKRDGKQGIYLTEGSARKFVEVDVLAANKEFAIIRAANPETPLVAKQRYEIR